jgi:hypothetical protein
MTTFVLTFLVYSISILMACYAVAGAICTYINFKRDVNELNELHDSKNGES